MFYNYFDVLALLIINTEVNKKNIIQSFLSVITIVFSKIRTYSFNFKISSTCRETKLYALICLEAWKEIHKGRWTGIGETGIGETERERQNVIYRERHTERERE